MYFYCVLTTLIQYHFWNSSTLMYIELVHLALFPSSWITWIHRYLVCWQDLGYFQIWDTVNSAALIVIVLAPGNVCCFPGVCHKWTSLVVGPGYLQVHWKECQAVVPSQKWVRWLPFPARSWISAVWSVSYLWF